MYNNSIAHLAIQNTLQQIKAGFEQQEFGKQILSRELNAKTTKAADAFDFKDQLNLQLYLQELSFKVQSITKVAESSSSSIQQLSRM